MATQTQRGKAFEYACLRAVEESLHTYQDVRITDSGAFRIAQGFYAEFQRSDPALISKLDRAARAATRIICRLEPQLQNPEGNDPLYLSIQADSQGIAGDVRDVMCIRLQNGWEIGISCKHNHAAVKHSRLSYTIDFGAQWFGRPCSTLYFNAIRTLFEELVELTRQGQQWSNLRNKADRFYQPLLTAFIDELSRLNYAHPGEIPGSLLRYLLGRNDFYKVITNDPRKITTIQAFNIYGTLNRSSGRIRSEVNIPPLIMPDQFYDISYKPGSQNTIIVTCNNGWAISFRIHNASTNVEPSLKFDIQLVGVPPTLHTQVEPWEI
jgi:hypothetical protein